MKLYTRLVQIIALVTLAACSGGAPLKSAVTTPTPTIQNPQVIPTSTNLSCTLSGIGSAVELQADASGNIIGNNLFNISVTASQDGFSNVPVVFTAFNSDPAGAFSIVTPPGTLYAAAPVIQIRELLADQTVRFTAEVKNSSGNTAVCSISTSFTKKVLSSPTVLLTANNLPDYVYIDYNGSANIAWNSTNMASCQLKNNADGSLLGFNSLSGVASFANLNASKSYKIECMPTSSYPQSLVSAVVEVRVRPAPTGTIKVNNSSSSTVQVANGIEFNLAWQASNVANCSVINNSNTIATGLSGEKTIVATATIQLYELRCYNSSGVKVYSKSVAVSPASLTASISGPSQVAYSGKASLTWTRSNPTATCRIVDDFNGASYTVTASPFLTPELLEGLHNFTITCTDGSLTASGSHSTNVGAPTDHLIFVTGGTFDGNLGGVSGADSKCQVAANAAGLRADRPWKAILSTNNVNATPRISIFGDVYKQNAAKVKTRVSYQATFWSAWMTDGANFTETGSLATITATVTDPLSKTVVYVAGVWTDTKSDGTVSRPLKDCNEWTSNTSGKEGVYGASGRIDATRLDSGNIWTCSEPQHLYCISQ